jgi:hypothetical protein
MKETIKGIAAGIGGCLCWAVMIAGCLWLWDSAKREGEAKAEAARIARENREIAQRNYDEAMIRYQIGLQERAQRLENDRILEEQERMLMRVQPMRPLQPLPRYR